jgi:hypothetical protein
LPRRRLAGGWKGLWQLADFADGLATDLCDSLVEKRHFADADASAAALFGSK